MQLFSWSGAMYHAIVARRLRSTIARLSAGDIGYVAGQFSEPVVHEFAGDHALVPAFADG